MTKKITCIECPKGCSLSVETKDGKTIVSVSGNECPKGEGYAVLEIENPLRILTSTVKTKGLSLKMIPVRTTKPIPKVYIMKAIDEIRRIKVNKPLGAGDVIVRDFLGTGADLVSTRDCLPEE